MSGSPKTLSEDNTIYGMIGLYEIWSICGTIFMVIITAIFMASKKKYKKNEQLFIKIEKKILIACLICRIIETFVFGIFLYYGGKYFITWFQFILSVVFLIFVAISYKNQKYTNIYIVLSTSIYFIEIFGMVGYAVTLKP